jgi:antitoxin (DNA-binding transcriptional repressor) of toxin-antitoxin stability system
LSIRELKANPARAIELVQKGELVEITTHRKVVADLITPATQPNPKEPNDEQALKRLIVSGLVEPADKPLKLGRAVKLARHPNVTAMGELVIGMRGSRQLGRSSWTSRVCRSLSLGVLSLHETLTSALSPTEVVTKANGPQPTSLFQEVTEAKDLAARCLDLPLNTRLIMTPISWFERTSNSNVECLSSLAQSASDPWL